MTIWKRAVVCVSVAVIAIGARDTLAQTQRLTLSEAVAQAVERYPAVRAAAGRVDAAAAAVVLSRTTYLPRADLLWQTNRATRNNVSGYMFPQPVIGAVTGAVSPATWASAWNHSGGALVTWEPIDFGARRATVRAADAGRRAAIAGLEVARVDVAVSAAQAYLSVAEAEEGRRAAEAGVERARTVHTVVEARARAGLRPGADAARALAEVAVAETALARADQAVAIARADLAQWVGETAERAELAPPASELAQLPAPAIEGSPEARRQAATADGARDALTAQVRAHAPRIQLEGTAFTRASGVGPDGTLGTPLQHAHNWGVGMTVAFPLFDWPMQAARRASARARAREEEAAYDQTLVELRTAQARARAAFDTSARIAALAEPQVAAARAAEEQARARYSGGLGTIAEVADALRLLTEAEVNRAVSAVGVLQAGIGAAAAGGTLADVLDTIRAMEGR